MTEDVKERTGFGDRLNVELDSTVRKIGEREQADFHGDRGDDTLRIEGQRGDPCQKVGVVCRLDIQHA